MLDNPEISRKTLHDELAALIRVMILHGELSPGQRIPEQALCTRFGVSRTPLREALKVLSVERLVRLLPNRGAMVVRITPKEAEDLISLLGVLEAFAGDLACARINERQLEEVRIMHNRMIEHFRRNEKWPYIELNRAIHEAIILAAGNEVLTEIYHMLKTRLSSVLSVARNPPPRWSEAVEDHQSMLEALEARDGAAMELIARRHTRHRTEMVREALDMFEGRSRAAAKVAVEPPLEP
jgi:DNA-binding GntR family transcriptional regulator